MLKNE